MISPKPRPPDVPPLQLDEIRWQGWDAIRCVARECEMVVGVSAGPRILSLRLGDGDNLLHLDTTDFRHGEWRFYGGHRFTVAPEGPDSYVADNVPCEVSLQENHLSVAPTDSAGDQRRILEISAAADGTGFDVLHRLENDDDQPWRGALWGITAVPAAGQIISPHRGGPDSVRHWPAADGLHARIQWQAAHDHVVTAPNGARAKAGWHSHAGWLAWLRPDLAFIIHVPNVPAAEECVDEGCNIEVFTCPQYLEMETLGPRVTVPAGGRASLLQRWRLLTGRFSPGQWPELALRAGCLNPLPDPARSHGYAP